MITDLRTPTAYTYNYTIYVSSCATNPVTDIVIYTAEVDGNSYVASWSGVFSAAPVVYETFIFTGLTVTSLTPGQEISVVCSTISELMKTQ